jgi:diaminohydroxyphosphoribosylaminopyrimidine deaminase / 5-amino-6-(5-phosphoribosylamino)uracil reductase
MFSDEELMVVALSEATKVHKRQVLPNPRVGAAILTKDHKLFFGHHKKSGQPHAEVEAIRAAKEKGADLTGATIAVTLEPCSHTGKTPPCADALIENRFAKVIVGLGDPDPRVNGLGVKKLQDAGIEVVDGLLADRCHEVNKEWLFAKLHSRPYVYLKMATSLDGLWTAESGASKWITGTEARQHAQTLRSDVGVIVTSLKTVIADDPLMNARDSSGKANAFQPDLAVLSRQSEWGKRWSEADFKCQNVDIRKLHEWRQDDLPALLESLFRAGHVACLIEAGPALSSEFLKLGLVQEIWHYQGARYLGGEGQRLSTFTQGQLPGLECSVKEIQSFENGEFFVKSLPAFCDLSSK